MRKHSIQYQQSTRRCKFAKNEAGLLHGLSRVFDRVLTAVAPSENHVERAAPKVMVSAACKSASDEKIDITPGSDKGCNPKHRACLALGTTPRVPRV